MALKMVDEQDGVAAIPRASRRESPRADLDALEDHARRCRPREDCHVAERKALRQSGSSRRPGIRTCTHEAPMSAFGRKQKYYASSEHSACDPKRPLVSAPLGMVEDQQPSLMVEDAM